MGEERVNLAADQNTPEMKNFVRHLLHDVQAMEYMLRNDWFETDVQRIGAEQEMCLINKHYKPSYKAMDILKDFSPEWLTTELAQFNLEINLSPQLFEGDALGLMEAQIRERLEAVNEVALRHGARILLTGILPSLRKFDLNIDKLTPKERYLALMTALKKLRGGADYELKLAGIDELNISHDTPLLEACNTSFQVHLQVTPDNFVKMYNISQALAGPVLAMSANSPVLFGKRLWHETRIALFQQSIDNRKSQDHLRQRSPRVNFGMDWLKKSVMEIYKEDITRFRILLGSDIPEDSMQAILEGKTPHLHALRIHNGTVYRWNRPCYGISDNGKPHLRIENRVMAAGPTVLDEIANAAFWLGAMEGVADHVNDITELMSFDDVSDNFTKGARLGIDCEFNWMNDQKISARELTLKELLPLARAGLQKHRINPEHIDKYLGIIEERARRHMNGARWILRTFTKFKKETNVDESLTSLTAAILHNQRQSKPAHTWEIPELHEFDRYDPSHLLVEEFMSTDLLTVQRGDILEFASNLITWSDADAIPVEDENGHLVGLVTAKMLLRHFTTCQQKSIEDSPEVVGDIMEANPITVSPQTSILEVIRIMRTHNIRALPVVKNKELIGMVWEKNFVQISKRLIQRMYLDQQGQGEE